MRTFRCLFKDTCGSWLGMAGRGSWGPSAASAAAMISCTEKGVPAGGATYTLPAESVLTSDSPTCTPPDPPGSLWGLWLTLGPLPTFPAFGRRLGEAGASPKRRSLASLGLRLVNEEMISSMVTIWMAPVSSRTTITSPSSPSSAGTGAAAGFVWRTGRCTPELLLLTVFCDVPDGEGIKKSGAKVLGRAGVWMGVPRTTACVGVRVWVGAGVSV